MSNNEPNDKILQSVEQITALQELHKSASVITIKGWVALVFIALFFFGALFWSFAGRLPITVEGKGTLLQDQTILGFFPLFSGQQIKVGMRATVSLDTVDTSRYGRIEGVVKEVYPYPVSKEDARLEEIPSASLREYFTQGDVPTILVVIEPLHDSETWTGLQWTSKTGPKERIPNGSVGQVEITLKTIKPINYVIPQA